MKPLQLFLLLLFGLANSCTFQSPQSGQNNLTNISTDSIKDVGKIPYGKEILIPFIVKNSGQNVLHIHNVEPVCGCTRVNYSKEPVKPGNSIKIELYYDAKSFGTFFKEVKIFCNTPESVYILKFKGEIIDEEYK